MEYDDALSRGDVLEDSMTGGGLDTGCRQLQHLVPTMTTASSEE
jgi:hypothetical protein